MTTDPLRLVVPLAHILDEVDVASAISKHQSHSPTSTNPRHLLQLSASTSIALSEQSRNHTHYAPFRAITLFSPGIQLKPTLHDGSTSLAAAVGSAQHRHGMGHPAIALRFSYDRLTMLTISCSSYLLAQAAAVRQRVLPFAAHVGNAGTGS